MSSSVNVFTKKDVCLLLHDVLKHKNLLNAEVHIDKGSGKGDGFMSVMTKVTIKDGNNKLHVIIKSAPVGNFRKIAPITEAYNKEVYFYNTIMPSMIKFQADRNVIKPFKNIPQCYLTSTEKLKECIVMENLRESGYDLLNRKIQMDDAHVSLMLEAYAKFHAISFAMQDQDNALYKKITGNFSELFKDVAKDLLHQFTISVDKTIALYNNDVLIQDRLKKFQATILPFLDSLDTNKWKYEVLCHADCWTNNMMFRYQNQKPVDICLIDFQAFRKSSPVLDISVCIYASASHKIYENLDHYINLYHKNLSDHLKVMGTDIDKMYPLTALKEDWKKYSFFGYIFAPMVIRTLLKEQDSMLDISDIAENGSSFEDVFNSNVEDSDVADERVKRLTMHMINEEYI